MMLVECDINVSVNVAFSTIALKWRGIVVKIGLRGRPLRNKYKVATRALRETKQP